jgi:hypothetical protein
VSWRITNLGREGAVDVTLLYIDSQRNIQSVFPRANAFADNRIRAGQMNQINLPPVRVTADTLGIESVLLIAVPGEGPPMDFTFLEQTVYERAKGTASRGSGDNTLEDTPLGALLSTDLYNRPSDRGLDTRLDLKRHRLIRQSFEVAGQD